MGLDLKPIIPREKITLNEFSSRIIAIDTYNTLYQFLTTIRGADGLQLTDHFGKITSHISGFFYRNINFLSFGIKPVYVFDGKPSSLKSIEITRRKELKKKANIKYEKAMQYNDINNMKKYAQQSTYIKEDMIADIKYILDYLKMERLLLLVIQKCK